MTESGRLLPAINLARKWTSKCVSARKKREEDARRALLLRFESLGENCELGFVQEAFGAHPLGLFRWSGITLPHLVTALDTDLSGIGEAQFTEIYSDDIYGEYYYRDLRYGMYTHTKLFKADYSAEQADMLLRTRTRRLCEKLVEDIQDAQKIFVFQSGSELALSEMRQLHGALKRLNDSVSLLFIKASQDRTCVGTAKSLEPGLMLGFLDRIGFQMSRQPHWQISYQTWLSVLAAAARCCGHDVPKAATADTATLDLPRDF